MDAGPLGPDGNSLGWRDIEAWQNSIGIVLEPWEGRLIKRLSREYGVMRHLAEKADCAAPYTVEEKVKESRDRVTGQFAALVKAFGAKPRG